MKDAEVGELWAKAKLPVVRDLIRKLVKERAYGRDGVSSFSKHEQLVFLRDALRDFGISPETWSKK